MTDNRKHWYLSKAIQLPVVILVLTNVFGSIWWAAEINAKTQSVISASVLSDKLHVRDVQINNNTQNIDRVYNSINKLDAKIDKVLMRIK